MVWFFVVASVTPAGLSARQAATEPVPAPEVRVASADDLHGRLLPQEALDAYEAVLADSPDHYSALWKAAREAVILGIMEPEEADQNRWFRVGEGYGRRAVAVAPDEPEGHYWLAAALGRRAVQSPPLATGHLAREVFRTAHRVLALDSMHAGAHNVLGKLNLEVMKLSGVKRIVARNLFGDELKRTSWADAERYLTTAVALDTTMVLYRVDLGWMYLERGEVAAARVELERALDLPVRIAADPALKEQARRLLERAR